MTTLEQLSNILVEHYKIDPARLTLHEPLEQLGIDSLGMAELLFFIEDEFHVQLPGDAPLLPTLADAVHYIDGLVAAQHARQVTAGEAPAPPVAPSPPA
jgi:acyl carrier protein